MQGIGLRKTFIAVLVALGVFVASGSAFAAGYLYRYVDENGTPVIGRSIPPEHARLGYTVLTEQMRVVRVVPPQLSGEALEKKIAEEERQRALKELDDYLKSHYNTPQDVEAARDRKVGELGLFIESKKKTLDQARKSLDEATAQAANMERRGQEVPPRILANIQALQGNVREEEERLENMREELTETRMRFAEMIERMHVLTGTSDLPE